jgi:hypothetical protein
MKSMGSEEVVAAQDDFWALVKKSADYIRKSPQWQKGGISIQEDGYTTLGSSLKSGNK